MIIGGWGSGLSLSIRNTPAPSHVAHFSGTPLLAEILNSRGLAESLASGRAQNLSEAISQLNPADREALRNRWGRSLEEIESLSQERDARVFYSGLLQIGQRLEDNDQLELAGVVYSVLVAAGNSPRPPLILRGGEQGVLPVLTSREDGEEVPPLRIRGGQEGLSPVPAEIRHRAQIRLNAMTGVGSSGERIAFLARRISTEATRPDMLLAMGAAGAAFRLTRFAATARFAGTIESGFGLRATANTAGFLAETLAFTGAGKISGAAFGYHQDWNPEAVFREWAGGATMLLGLKVVGAGVGHLSERWASTDSAFGRFTQTMAPQVGMFGGILAGNRFSEWAGFHPHREGDTWFVDGLSTLLQFNVAGRLQSAALGPGFARFERRVDLHTETLTRDAMGRPGILDSLATIVAPDFVTAEGVRISGSEGPHPYPSPPRGEGGRRPGEGLVFSVRHDGETGGGASSTPPRPVARPPIQIFPLMEISRSLTFDRSFETALDNLAEHVLLVEVYSDYQGIDRPLSPTENGLQELRVRFSRALYDSRTLGEIRIHLGDGSMMWVARNHQGRMLYGYEGADVSREIERARAYPQERTQTFFLTSPVNLEAPQTLWSRVFNVLREKSRLSRQDVADRLNARTDSVSDRYTIGKIENHGTDALQFDRLRALAEIFSVQTRDLAQILNLSRHQQGLYKGVRPQDWMTEPYPIYLETPADLDRLRLYRESDPFRESIGWTLYSARKNPERYFNLPQLSQETGIQMEILTDLELNRPHYLTLANFTKLAETLDISLYRLLRPANRTRYPHLDLDELFGDQALYIDPDSEDVAKVESYLQRPGSLGQYLFAARHAQDGYPSTVVLARRLGRRITYWNDREWNRVAVDGKNWRDWVGLFSALNLPLFPLRAPLKKLGFALESAPVLLAYGVGDESLIDLNQRSGVAPRTVAGAMLPDPGDAPAVLSPETILTLQRALPKLRGDLLYLAMHPEIRDFFPETHSNEPSLTLPTQFIEDAMRLHLGERLFAHRMNHDKDLLELGVELGLSREYIFRNETRVIDDVDFELIHRAPSVLGINSRQLYLHYRPEILALFEWREPRSHTSYRISPEEYQRLLALKTGVRDLRNRRNALEQAMDGRGIEGEAGLARFLKVKASEAQKFLKSSRALSQDDISLITRSFSELSYQDWYEHFNRPALAYFLGRNSEGGIDYSIPEGMTPKQLERLNLAGRIRAATDALPSIRAAMRKSGVGFLDDSGELADSIRRRTWEDRTLARLALGLGLDRRLLYMFMKLPELRPMLAGNGATPPPDIKTPSPRSRRPRK